MRNLHPSSRFKKDYKKLNLKPKYQDVLKDTIDKLAKGELRLARLNTHSNIYKK